MDYILCEVGQEEEIGDGYRYIVVENTKEGVGYAHISETGE